MDYRETDFQFLRDDLVNGYGEEQGGRLYTLMCEKYTALCEGEVRSKNPEMNRHIFNRLLPVIGMYLTLIENGFTKEQALAVANRKIQQDARSKAEENMKLTKMPFTYRLFKMFARSHMNKKYPSEGFAVEWKRHDNEEIHFNIARCLYMDLCKKYDCPDLCAAFCRSDITAFAGYEPKICFQRVGTIAEGCDFCDFHFIRGDSGGYKK